MLSVWYSRLILRNYQCAVWIEIYKKREGLKSQKLGFYCLVHTLEQQT